MSTLVRLLRFLRPFSWRVALSVLLGVLTVGSGIGLLGTSAYLIASAALQPSVAALQVAIVGVRFFGISRAVFRYLERLESHAVNFRLLAELRTWFYHALEPLAPARLQKHRSADLLARAVADIETLEHFYVRAVAPPMVAIVITAGASWFAGSYDARSGWLLFAALLCAGAGVPALAYLLNRRTGKTLVRQRAALHFVFLDLVQGLPDLLAFGQAGAQRERVREVSGALARTQGRFLAVGALANALTLLLNGLALWGVLVVAVPMVGQQIDGVTLAVLALVTLASFEAAAALTPAAQHLESSLEAARRLFALVDAEPAVREPEQPIPPPKEFSLSIRGLGFAYPDDAGQDSRQPVLDDFSLDLPRGKRVAVVGPSGAGKTSLINLLLRFWEFDCGEILLDGCDIRAYRQEDVRRGMAVVNQSTYLFAGTLRLNLLVACPKAGQDALDEVIRLAQLGGLVAELPDGLDTWVGEQGLRLSGGERQRLAVARALLQDAPLLLLDEPTANLDAENEQRLMRILHEAGRGRSMLLITHRLVGLAEMDEVLVLEAGRVVERGTHAQLLSSGGRYADLWALHKEQLLPA